ncbi:MAG: pyridoxamine 5'-phosphate oxidase family protein [Pseudomonadota bacterium]
MSDVRESLSATRELAWRRLLAAPNERTCPFRTPALCTNGTNGPEARLLVLRAVKDNPLTLVFHTDAASGKVTQLKTDPRAAFLFWDPIAGLQVRIRATIAQRPGTAEEWSKIPQTAQQAYGGTPPPGTVMAGPRDHDPAPDPERHMILTAQVIDLETLWIDRLPHVRASFNASDGFQGQWLAP